MTRDELIEHLADAEHASWARWMAYLFTKGEHHPDGSFTLPGGYVAALQRQIATPYHKLTEHEKQGDRDEVAHILPAVERYALEHPRAGEMRAALVQIAAKAGKQADHRTIFVAATNALGGIEHAPGCDFYAAQEAGM